MFDAVADGFEHAPDLPIYSLPQDNAEACRRDRPELLNFRALAIEHNSTQQSRRERPIPWSIESQLIFLLHLIAWVGESLRQFTVVRQKQQTFGLRIQTPDSEEAGKFCWQEIKDGVPRVRILSS